MKVHLQSLLFLSIVFALAGVISCGSTGGSNPPGPSIAVSNVSPASVTLTQGGSSQTIAVTLTRTNFTGSVTLNLSALPSGVTSNITQPGTGNSGSISLQAASNAALVSNQTIAITASGAGVANATASFTLSVIAPGQGQSATFTVNTAVTHQTWRGFIATGPANPNHLINSVCALEPAATRTAVLDAVDDMGVTGVYTMIYHKQTRLEFDANGPWPAAGADNNDNPDPLAANTTYFYSKFEGFLAPQIEPCDQNLDTWNYYIIPFRQRILASGRPFEVHGFAHTENTTTDWPSFWRSTTTELAEPHVAWAQWINSRFGFYPDSGGWNEPGYALRPTNYIGPALQNIGDRIAAISGQARTARCTDEVVPAEAINSWINQLSAAAKARCFLYSYHGYDSNNLDYPDSTGISNRNTIRSQAAAEGTPTAMTEICCGPGWANGTVMFTGLRLLRDIYVNAVEADISYWYLAGWPAVHCEAANPNCSTASGTNRSGDLIGISNDLNSVYLLPTYWTLRQFSKYVQPGDVRLDMACSGGGCTFGTKGPAIKATAWRKPTGKLVIHIMNEAGSTSSSVTITGIPSGNYDVYMLDPTLCVSSGPTNRCTPQSMVVAGSPNITLTIPTDGVWTLVQQ